MIDLKKYEEFKRLTPEQKEEYEFYFGKQERINKYKFSFLDLANSIIYFAFSMLLFSIFALMLYKLEFFNKETIIKLIEAVYNIFYIARYAIMFVILLMFVERASTFYTYIKFIKKLKKEEEHGKNK